MSFKLQHPPETCWRLKLSVSIWSHAVSSGPGQTFGRKNFPGFVNGVETLLDVRRKIPQVGSPTCRFLKPRQTYNPKFFTGRMAGSIGNFVVLHQVMFFLDFVLLLYSPFQVAAPFIIA
jgi:hypothetical protein